MVLRPFTEALWETTAEAIAPRLAQLRDGFPMRLETKTELANERLDEALARIDPRLFVKVQLALQGREIETRADLDTLLRDIDGRISPMLAKKQRVRIT